ncbi:hypothetical protein Tco_0760889, partial [Tanacetum coccineum]
MWHPIRRCRMGAVTPSSAAERV